MKWIDVEKKKPKKFQEVLVTDGKEFEFAMLIDEFHLETKPTGCVIWSFTKGPTMYIRSLRLDDVTHWMEIEPPKKETKK